MFNCLDYELMIAGKIAVVSFVNLCRLVDHVDVQVVGIAVVLVITVRTENYAMLPSESIRTRNLLVLLIRKELKNFLKLDLMIFLWA
jgi:hypothetical protein